MFDPLIHLATVLSSAGFSPLNILLIIMLYFMGTKLGIFPKFWKQKDDEQPDVIDGQKITLRDVYLQMTHLKAHYNDETTEELQKINRTQSKIKEDTEEIKQFHKNYHEYGIKVRTQ